MSAMTAHAGLPAGASARPGHVDSSAPPVRRNRAAPNETRRSSRMVTSRRDRSDPAVRLAGRGRPRASRAGVRGHPARRGRVRRARGRGAGALRRARGPDRGRQGRRRHPAGARRAPAGSRLRRGPDHAGDDVPERLPRVRAVARDGGRGSRVLHGRGRRARGGDEGRRARARAHRGAPGSRGQGAGGARAHPRAPLGCSLLRPPALSRPQPDHVRLARRPTRAMPPSAGARPCRPTATARPSALRTARRSCDRSCATSPSCSGCRRARPQPSTTRSSSAPARPGSPPPCTARRRA